MKKKQIALTNNQSLSFLSNFKIPRVKLKKSIKIHKKDRWIYLCNYKNNISNIKMNINLFYKFTQNKPKNYKWYAIEKIDNLFLPSFTKRIIKKINKVYIN